MTCGCTYPDTLPQDRRIAASPLMAHGGFVIIPGLYGENGVKALLSEAIACYSGSWESNTPAPDTEEMRGGNPARRFLSCGAGPVQDHYYLAPQILAFLGDLTGLQISSTGKRGTYTYYVRPGDYLDIHRDIRTCDLAVVTCLMDTAGPGESGGRMEFYPTRTREPLSHIRSSPAQGRVSVRLHPGETAIMLGGIVPHAIAAVGPTQQRIVSVLCYEAH